MTFPSRRSRRTRILRRGLAAAALLAAAPGAHAMLFSEALRLALERDPTVAESVAQFEADRENSAIERGGLLPQAGINGNVNSAHTKSDGVFGVTTDGYNAWGAQATLRQPIFRLDWFDRLDRAKALDSQAQLALRQRKLELVGKASQRYLDVLQAVDQLRLAEAEASAFHESLDATRKRYDVELVPGMDVKEAQARDDMAQARLLAAHRNVDIARDALDETTGNGYDRMPMLREDLKVPPVTPVDIDDWVRITRENSPRIATAQRQIDVAKSESEARRADFYPTVDLVGTVGRDDTHEYVFGQKIDDRRIGVEVNIPIYSGGVTSARARQADASLRVAQAEFTRVSVETERTARQVFREAQNAFEEVGAFEKTVVSAQAAEAATSAGYDAGTRTISDVLDARSRTVQARRDLNGSRYTLLTKLLSLKQVAGILQESDLLNLDDLLAYPPEHP